MSQFAVPASSRPSSASDRAAIIWGIVVGIIQAATPLVFWWLDSSTVYALGLADVVVPEPVHRRRPRLTSAALRG